ncbi:hypothetical protein JE959_000130 [Aeromonas veronii]|nr:hypothetical protein [Aeromonas veronii]
MKSGNLSPFYLSADAYLNKGNLDQSIFAAPEYLDHIETKISHRKKTVRSLNRKNLFLSRKRSAKSSIKGKDINGNSYHNVSKPRDVRAKIAEQEQRLFAGL